ncbi:MAG: hypothetical protein OEV93_04060 [Candidatus Moranbacteria bacterium]|nr:hypothetical protein [Candidatus Moranbacteria bacterium]
MDIIQISLIFSVLTLAVLVFVLLRLIRKMEAQFKEMKGLKLDDLHLEDRIDEESQKLKIEQQNIQNDILKRVAELEGEISDLGDFVEAKLGEIDHSNNNDIEISQIRSEEKELRDDMKEQIFELFESNDSLVNDDIERELGISDAIVTRYLSELEEEGKIERIGESGRFVEYKKTHNT